MEYSKHPIVLNLDLPQVIAMTIGLIEVSRQESLFSAQFEKVAKDVYSNLTDYAKGKLIRLMKEKNISFDSSEVDEYEQTLSNSIITMWKSGCTGTIQVCLEDIDYVYKNCHVIDYEGDKVRIVTKDKKEIELSFADIFCCEYEMEREYEYNE